MNEDLLMQSEVELVVGAGAGDGNVAARVGDRQACVGGQSLVNGLVAVVAVTEELVDIVGAEVETVRQEVAALVVQAMKEKSAKGQQNDKKDDSAADAAARVGSLSVAVKGEVEDPLQQ